VLQSADAILSSSFAERARSRAAFANAGHPVAPTPPAENDPPTDAPTTTEQIKQDDLFEVHFVLAGPRDTDFEGGLYHGRITLPPAYPHAPPEFRFLSPNGRFETGVKICLSISSHHPEHWRPSWGVRTALTALAAFLPTPGHGAIGALDHSGAERRAAAARSRLAAPRFGGPERQAVTDALHARILARQAAEAAAATVAAEAEAEAAAKAEAAGAEGQSEEGAALAAQATAEAAAAAAAAAAAPASEAAAPAMKEAPEAPPAPSPASAPAPAPAPAPAAAATAAAPAPAPAAPAPAAPPPAEAAPPAARAAPAAAPAPAAALSPPSPSALWSDRALALLALALAAAVAILTMRKLLAALGGGGGATTPPAAWGGGGAARSAGGAHEL